MKVEFSTTGDARITLKPETDAEVQELKAFQAHKNKHGGVLSLHPSDDRLDLVLTDLEWYSGQLRGR